MPSAHAAKRLLILVGSMMVLSLSSCAQSVLEATPPSATPAPSVQAPDPETTATPAQATPLEPKPGASSQPFLPEPAPSSETVAVTLYRPNTDCTDLVAEQVQVPAERAMEEAVGKVLQEQLTADFELSGYRVKVDPNGTATVDFRRTPGALRSFTSLSSCEQFALFGSLRETLTQHPDWKVKSVQFTDRGQKIGP